MHRRTFLLASSVMALGLAACGDGSPTLSPAFVPATDRPTFVFFYATDEDVSPQMQPVVDAVRAQYESRVAFFYLDANGAGKPVAERYDFVGHPGYLLLRKDGSEAWRFLGQRTQAQFATAIEAVLAAP